MLNSMALGSGANIYDVEQAPDLATFIKRGTWPKFKTVLLSAGA